MERSSKTDAKVMNTDYTDAMEMMAGFTISGMTSDK